MIEEARLEQLAAWRKFLHDNPEKMQVYFAQIHFMESSQLSFYLCDQFKTFIDEKMLVTAYDLRVVLGEVKTEKLDGINNP